LKTILLFILFSTIVFSQSLLLLGDDGYYSYTSPTVSPDADAGSITAIGNRTKTKATKTTGTSRTPVYRILYGQGNSITDSTLGRSYSFTTGAVLKYVFRFSLAYTEGDGTPIYRVSALDSVYSICDTLANSLNGLFTDITDAELDTWYESNPNVISGLTCDATGTITTADADSFFFKIGALGTSVQSATVSLGDSIYLLLKSPDDSTSSFSVQFKVSGVTLDTWTVTTLGGGGDLPDGLYITTEDELYFTTEDGEFITLEE
jgi:hypothetical protein